METLKIILLVILLIGVWPLLLFTWAKIIRLFKKKSHHYLVPPTPEKDPNWRPIKFSEYTNFIFTNNGIESFLIEKLNQILESDRDNTSLITTNIELNKADVWQIAKINSISFFEFKSIVCWLDNQSINNNSKSDVIGFCGHKRNPQKDYLFKVDIDTNEHIIGTFRNGKNFGIYLPNADLHESGNISLTRNKEIDFYSETSKLPIEYMDKKMIPFDFIINTTANNGEQA